MRYWGAAAANLKPSDSCLTLFWSLVHILYFQNFTKIRPQVFFVIYPVRRRMGKQTGVKKTALPRSDDEQSKSYLSKDVWMTLVNTRYCCIIATGK